MAVDHAGAFGQPPHHFWHTLLSVQSVQQGSSALLCITLHCVAMGLVWPSLKRGQSWQSGTVQFGRETKMRLKQHIRLVQ